MAEKSLFCAKIAGTGSRTEGSSYKFNVLNLVDVYEIKGNDKVPLCSKLTVRCSPSLGEAVANAREIGLEEFYFTAQWEEQTMFYVGTVVTAPVKRLTNVKACDF